MISVTGMHKEMSEEGIARGCYIRAHWRERCSEDRGHFHN